MKKLLLFAILLGTAPVVSQETETQRLLAMKNSLEQEIMILQDSLDQIKRRIDSAKSAEIKQEPVKKLSLGPNELMAQDKLQIRLEPDLTSKVVLELEGGTRVLKIDKIGEFFLVCYQGTCGYAPRTLLEDTNNEKKEDERSSAPNS